MNKLKEFFEELMIIHEQIIWQNSAERRALAIERIAAVRRGENPYADLME